MTDAEFIKKTTAAFRAQRDARDIAVAKIIIITTAVEAVAQQERTK